MLLLRSEEQTPAWSQQNGLPVGAILSVEQIWELSLRWYADRMSPDYSGRGADTIKSILDSLGLCGDYWHVE